MFKSTRQVGALAGGRPRAPAKREARHETMRGAVICIDGAELAVAATLRDHSERGARLSVITAQPVPDEIMLVVRSLNLAVRGRIVWRRQLELGVRFTSRGEEARLRELQGRYWQGLRAEQARQAELQERAAWASQQSRAQTAAQLAQGGAVRLGTAQGAGFAAATAEIAHLRLLELEPGGSYTLDDLKSAYRRRAMTVHPDRGGDPELFQAINDAFQSLCTAMLVAAAERD